MSNMLGVRREHYPDAAPGRADRRTTARPQAVLDAAYRLIQHNNPDRLEVAQNGIDKRLISAVGDGRTRPSTSPSTPCRPSPTRWPR